MKIALWTLAVFGALALSFASHYLIFRSINPREPLWSIAVWTTWDCAVGVALIYFGWWKMRKEPQTVLEKTAG